MDRLALLSGDHGQEDQVLETDIMRFLAIIGFVFWILFSIVKSIPFRIPAHDSSLHKVTSVEKPEPAPAMSKAVIKEETFAIKPFAKENVKPVFDQQKKQNAGNISKKQEQIAKSEKPSGLHMQFYSLDDLLSLMTKGRVRIFCLARARGFELFFEGHSAGGSVTFKGVSVIPESLWEIKSGKDRAYFLEQMTRGNPAIQSFTKQQILVFFADKGMENRLTQRLRQLQEDGKNGILSITDKGDVVFRDFGQSRKTGNDAVTEGGKQ